MSPVSTATRVLSGKASSVLSSSVVLPEPGELIRFRQSTPWSAKRRRSSAAMRSFSLRTFRSNGTWLIVLHFQRSQLQLVSAGELSFRGSATGTAQVVLRDPERLLASRAALLARACFDFQLQRLQPGIPHQHFKTEAESFRVNPRELPHAYLYLA